MKKAFPFLPLIAVFFFFSCNHPQSPQQTNDGNVIANSGLADTTTTIAWEVKGCAQKAAATKSQASGDYSDYPELRGQGTGQFLSDGDSIVYSRTVSHLCCREVKLSTQKEQFKITITEYWFRQGCKCQCSSTVRLVINRLPKGEYKVYAIETGTNPVDDKPSAAADTVLQQKITIR